MIVLIDVQKGFVSGGNWPATLPDPTDVQPIEEAFNRISQLLPTLSHKVNVMTVQFLFNEAITNSVRDTELTRLLEHGT
jgi:nicotinamidase-related amidase